MNSEEEADEIVPTTSARQPRNSATRTAAVASDDLDNSRSNDDGDDNEDSLALPPQQLSARLRAISADLAALSSSAASPASSSHPIAYRRYRAFLHAVFAAPDPRHALQAAALYLRLLSRTALAYDELVLSSCLHYARKHLHAVAAPHRGRGGAGAATAGRSNNPAARRGRARGGARRRGGNNTDAEYNDGAAEEAASTRDGDGNESGAPTVAPVSPGEMLRLQTNIWQRLSQLVSGGFPDPSDRTLLAMLANALAHIIRVMPDRSLVDLAVDTFSVLVDRDKPPFYALTAVYRALFPIAQLALPGAARTALCTVLARTAKCRLTPQTEADGDGASDVEMEERRGDAEQQDEAPDGDGDAEWAGNGTEKDQDRGEDKENNNDGSEEDETNQNDGSKRKKRTLTPPRLVAQPNGANGGSTRTSTALQHPLLNFLKLSCTRVADKADERKSLSQLICTVLRRCEDNTLQAAFSRYLESLCTHQKSAVRQLAVALVGMILQEETTPSEEDNGNDSDANMREKEPDAGTMIADQKMRMGLLRALACRFEDRIAVVRTKAITTVTELLQLEDRVPRRFVGELIQLALSPRSRLQDPNAWVRKATVNFIAVLCTLAAENITAHSTADNDAESDSDIDATNGAPTPKRRKKRKSGRDTESEGNEDDDGITQEQEDSTAVNDRKMENKKKRKKKHQARLKLWLRLARLLPNRCADAKALVRHSAVTQLSALLHNLPLSFDAASARVFSRAAVERYLACADDDDSRCRDAAQDGLLAMLRDRPDGNVSANRASGSTRPPLCELLLDALGQDGFINSGSARNAEAALARLAAADALPPVILDGVCTRARAEQRDPGRRGAWLVLAAVCGAPGSGVAKRVVETVGEDVVLAEVRNGGGAHALRVACFAAGGLRGARRQALERFLDGLLFATEDTDGTKKKLRDRKDRKQKSGEDGDDKLRLHEGENENVQTNVGSNSSTCASQRNRLDAANGLPEAVRLLATLRPNGGPGLLARCERLLEGGSGNNDVDSVAECALHVVGAVCAAFTLEGPPGERVISRVEALASRSNQSSRVRAVALATLGKACLGEAVRGRRSKGKKATGGKSRASATRLTEDSQCGSGRRGGAPQEEDEPLESEGEERSVGADDWERLARRVAPLFVAELEGATTAATRANAVLALCDLCRRYTSVVEPFVPRLAGLLFDASSFVRTHVLASVTCLLQEDYLKVRGGFVLHQVARCIVDEHAEVARLAEYALLQVVGMKQGCVLATSFVELVFVLNECRAGPYSTVVDAAVGRSLCDGNGASGDDKGAAAAKKKKPDADGEAESGADNAGNEVGQEEEEEEEESRNDLIEDEVMKKKSENWSKLEQRERIYDVFLKGMTAEQRARLIGRLRTDVVCAILDLGLDVGVAGVQRVLRDTLFLLSSGKLNVKAIVGAADGVDAAALEDLAQAQSQLQSQSQTQGPAPDDGAAGAVSAAAPGLAGLRALRAAQVIELREMTVPALLELRGVLQQRRSPLLREVGACLRKLLRPHRNELGSFIRDATVRAEIEHEMGGDASTGTSADTGEVLHEVTNTLSSAMKRVSAKRVR